MVGVHIQVANTRVKVGRRSVEICEGGGAIPSSGSKIARREGSVLFDGGDRTGGGR